MTTIAEPLKYRRNKELALLRARGFSSRTDPAPTRVRLRQLLDAGAGWNELRAATGLSHSTMFNILEGTTPTVTRETERKIFTVRLSNVLTPSRRMPALGTIRRIRALYAAGHTTKAIERSSGLSHSLICHLASAKMSVVTAAVHDAIRGAYTELAPLTGTCARNRYRAERERWRHPGDWHDDDLDVADPDEDPDDIDPIAIERALAREPVELSRAERLEITRLLTGEGHAAHDIADRIGVTPRTVVRWRTAHGWKAAA